MSVATRHQHDQDRAGAVAWTRELLYDPDSVAVLDSETTGMDPAAEFCELAVVDGNGYVLFDSLVQPDVPVCAQAREVHGITDEDLADAPKFPELWPEFREALTGRQVVAYNAQFDRKVFDHVLKRHNLQPASVPPWQCAMLQYAKYRGEWNEEKGDYRWPKLEGGDHTALGDARATLGVMREMAGSIDPESRRAAQKSVRGFLGRLEGRGAGELASEEQIEALEALAVRTWGDAGPGVVEEDAGKSIYAFTVAEASAWTSWFERAQPLTENQLQRLIIEGVKEQIGRPLHTLTAGEAGEWLVRFAKQEEASA